MKIQLLCVMVVAFAATSYETRFNCADLKNCDKCPPVNKNCRNLRKCGCCHICRDKLNPAFIPKMFMKSYYASRPPPWSHDKKVKCEYDRCYCVYDGERLPRYFTFSTDVYNKILSCNCAYGKAKLYYLGIARNIRNTYQCDYNGGYDELACEGPFCYCANKIGVLFGNPLPRHNRDKNIEHCRAIVATKLLEGKTRLF